MSLFNLIGGVGSIGAGLALADDIRGTGADAASQMGELAGQLQNDTAFQGYGVQTGLGQTTVSPDGSTNLGVGPNQTMQNQAGGLQAGAGQAFGGAHWLANANAGNPAFGQALQTMGNTVGGPYGSQTQQNNAMQASNYFMGMSGQDTAGREQDIYNRSMAMQQPMLDAQRAQQQATEYARGRGGVRGSQFGGTAEDAATARAQAQAQNTAAFNAMGQAQNEMMNYGSLAGQYGQLAQGAIGQQLNAGNQIGQLGYNQAMLGQGAGSLMNQIGANQGQLGGQMYQQSFLPMDYQLQAAQLGGQNADRFQSGQFTGGNLAAQLGLGGIQTQVNAENAASQLYGNLIGGGLNAISNIQPNEGGFWASLGF